MISFLNKFFLGLLISTDSEIYCLSEQSIWYRDILKHLYFIIFYRFIAGWVLFVKSKFISTVMNLLTSWRHRKIERGISQSWKFIPNGPNYCFKCSFSTFWRISSQTKVYLKEELETNNLGSNQQRRYEIVNLKSDNETQKLFTTQASMHPTPTLSDMIRTESKNGLRGNLSLP